MRMEILERDKYKCRYCLAAVTNQTANIDHVIPWRNGGPTRKSNLVTACSDCNRKKLNREPIEPVPLRFAKQKGLPPKKTKGARHYQRKQLLKMYRKALKTHRRANCLRIECEYQHYDLHTDTYVSFPWEPFVNEPDFLRVKGEVEFGAGQRAKNRLERDSNRQNATRIHHQLDEEYRRIIS